MTPNEYYRNHCLQGLIVEDKQQLEVLNQLEKISQDLQDENRKRASVFTWFRQPKCVQGLYVWGGVGIGKTFLMDCFFQCIPFPKKIRMHFHQFMQYVHQELRKHQGKSDPIQLIAKELAQKACLLCFDELLVTDITDAMILARLFRALFDHGVCLVTTSNSAPDDLYKNGLQRKLFLPAIELLKQYTHVMHVPTHIDYRLRHLKTVGVFHTPDDDAANDRMQKSFDLLTANAPISHEPIEIHGRHINIIKQAGNVIWFDFKSLCDVPRSQHDYLALVQKYHTIFLSHIPVITSQAKNRINFLIRLIDVLYDARARLIFSAAVPIAEIYQHGPMLAEYTRTRSRLLEMQSEDYYASVSSDKRF